MKDPEERRLTGVVVAEHDHEELPGIRPSFKQFLLGDGPSLERLDIERDRSPMRKVKLPAD